MWKENTFLFIQHDLFAEVMIDASIHLGYVFCPEFISGIKVPVDSAGQPLAIRVCRRSRDPVIREK